MGLPADATRTNGSLHLFDSDGASAGASGSATGAGSGSATGASGSATGADSHSGCNCSGAAVSAPAAETDAGSAAGNGRFGLFLAGGATTCELSRRGLL